MLDLSKLYSWQYLTTDPGSAFMFQWYLVGVFTACVIISMVLITIRILNKKKMSDLSKRINILFFNWLLYPSIIGLLLVFFRNQEIPTLSWRLWLVALAITWLSGIIYILYFLFFIFPAESNKMKILAEKQKYIP